MNINLKGTFCLVFLLAASVWSSFAQSFVDMDFEQSTIISSSYSAYGYYYGTANVPGWTDGFTGNTFDYNALTLGTPAAVLVDSATWGVIDGTYSMLLQGFSLGSISVSQTALVPASTESLLFKAAQDNGGLLQVSLGGQNLSFIPIAVAANYTLYGANIPSGLSGQTEQLTFSALAENDNFWTIDDVQFSATPVPEPNSFVFFGLGGLLMACRPWRCIR